MSESFWQKNRLVTNILFDLCLFEHFSPVANFGQQSTCLKQANYWYFSQFYRNNKNTNVIPRTLALMPLVKKYLLPKGIEPDIIYTYPSIVLQLRRPQAPHLFTLAGAVWSGSRPSARPIVHNRRQFGANY